MPKWRIKRLGREKRKGLLLQDHPGGSYEDRIADFMARHKDPDVYHAEVAHGNNCRIYKGKGCSCQPWITYYKFNPETGEMEAVPDD